jgi:hypothetical protein
MSAIEYITSGGMAQIGGDLSNEQRVIAQNIVKDFAIKVKNYARQLQVNASVLKVRQCAYLFIGKDSTNFHFVFADSKSNNSINYRDLSSQGRIELQSIVRQINIDIGDSIWAFSCAQNISVDELDKHLDLIVKEYVKTVLESEKKPSKQISGEAISTPEIASGLERFRSDNPIEGSKTAFIIMKFGNTTTHNAIAECIKSTLSTYNIKSFRADDKDYMDDLLPNVKTYMHGCDFGIAVFERIEEENFNPNVSFEVGYMMGLSKEVLLLKDKTLKSLQTDLTGKLYKQFNTINAEDSIPEQLHKWLYDKGYIKQPKT